MPSTLTDTPTPQWGEVADWQLPLAQLCDSALPTGAFSHSFGLETYICEGVVDGEASFVSWLRALVSTQLTFSEGLGLRLAFEAVAADDWEAIAHLDALLVAQAVPLQVRRAGVTMGRRMLTIARLALEGTDGGRLLSRYAALIDTGDTGDAGTAGADRPSDGAADRSGGGEAPVGGDGGADTAGVGGQGSADRTGGADIGTDPDWASGGPSGSGAAHVDGGIVGPDGAVTGLDAAEGSGPHSADPGAPVADRLEDLPAPTRALPEGAEPVESAELVDDELDELLEEY